MALLPTHRPNAGCRAMTEVASAVMAPLARNLEALTSSKSS
jgi:hypothetical protein